MSPLTNQLATSADVLARGGGHDGGPRGFGLLLGILLIGGLIAFVVRRRRGRGHGHGHHAVAPPSAGGGAPTAMGLLQERFARGEIDAREYEHRRQVLEGLGDAPPPPPEAKASEDATPQSDDSSDES